MKNFKQTVKNVVAIGLLGLTLTSCYKDKFRDQVKLNNELAEANKGLKGQIVTLEDAVNDAQIEIEINAILIENLNGDTTTLSDQNNNLSETVIDLTTQIATIKSQIANTANTDDLNTDLRNKETALENALAKIHELTEVIRLLNREVENLQSIINELRDANTEYSLNQVELLATIDSLTVQIEDLVNAPPVIQYLPGAVTVSETVRIVDRIVRDTIQIAGDIQYVDRVVRDTIFTPGPTEYVDRTTIVTDTVEIDRLNDLLDDAIEALTQSQTDVLAFLNTIVPTIDGVSDLDSGVNVYKKWGLNFNDHGVGDITINVSSGRIIIGATNPNTDGRGSLWYNKTFNNTLEAASFFASFNQFGTFTPAEATAAGFATGW